MSNAARLPLIRILMISLIIYDIMKNDLEFRALLSCSLLSRLEYLGVAPSTFERRYNLAHGTFKNI